VFHSFFTPSDGVARWIPDAERFGEPNTIGEVAIPYS
jgi:hypothetical protein